MNAGVPGAGAGAPVRGGGWAALARSNILRTAIGQCGLRSDGLRNYTLRSQMTDLSVLHFAVQLLSYVYCVYVQ